MDCVYTKVQQVDLPFLTTLFAPFKEDYERTTRKRVKFLNDIPHSKEQKNGLSDYNAKLQRQDGIGSSHPETNSITIDPYGEMHATNTPVLKEYYFKLKLASEGSRKDNISGIEKQPISHSDCLSCMQFIYSKQDLSMPVSHQPVAYFTKLSLLEDH